MNAKELRHIRKTVLRWTQLKMANDLGITTTTLAGWEHGKKIPIPMQQLLTLKYKQRKKQKSNNKEKHN